MPYACELCGLKIGNHRFPSVEKHPEKFKEWVKAVTGKLPSPEDYPKYKYKRICDIHFRPEYRTRNGRVGYLAIPTLHLPNSSNTNVDEAIQIAAVPSIKELPPQIETTLEKVGCSDTRVDAASKTATVPSLKEPPQHIKTAFSQESVDAATADQLGSPIVDEHDYSSNEPAEIESVDAATADQLGSPIVDEHDYSSNEPAVIDRTPAIPDKCLTTNTLGVPNFIRNDHNYCSMDKTGIKKRLKIVNPAYLIAQLRDSRDKIKDLQREIRRLRKRAFEYKDQFIDLRREVKNLTRDNIRLDKRGLLFKSQLNESRRNVRILKRALVRLNNKRVNATDPCDPRLPWYRDGWGKGQKVPTTPVKRQRRRPTKVVGSHIAPSAPALFTPGSLPPLFPSLVNGAVPPGSLAPPMVPTVQAENTQGPMRLCVCANAHMNTNCC